MWNLCPFGAKLNAQRDRCGLLGFQRVSTGFCGFWLQCFVLDSSFLFKRCALIFFFFFFFFFFNYYYHFFLRFHDGHKNGGNNSRTVDRVARNFWHIFFFLFCFVLSFYPPVAGLIVPGLKPPSRKSGTGQQLNRSKHPQRSSSTG